MIKNEEKYANGNIKFKLKLIKIKEPLKLGKGIYQQMKTGNRVFYNKGTFNTKLLEDTFADLFKK